MKAKDGGPAFPCVTNSLGRSFAVQQIDPVSLMPILVVHNPGISRRDYFAAKAMQGWIVSFSEKDTPVGHEPEIAKLAYAIANAMIAESERET